MQTQQRKSRLLMSVASASILAFGLTSTAVAQETFATVDEVVVTARKVTENVQDVPISMSALDGRRLEQARGFTVEGLSNVVPNIKVMKTVGNSNAYSIFIRGVGRDNNAFIIESPIATYVDDVYYPYTTGPVLETGGVERVEVLRGPQGTLYGRNATIGAIKYYTVRPQLNDTVAGASVTAGTYGRFEARGHVGMPVVEDKVAVRFDVGRNYYDGYMKDRISGDHLGGTNSISARAALVWQATDNLQIYTAIDGLKADDETAVGTPHLNVDTVPVPRYGSAFITDNIIADEVNDLEVLGGTVQGTYELGFGQFKSVTAYREIGQHYAVDASAGLNTTSQLNARTNDKTFTQEFQLTGSMFADRLDYVAGLFYQDSSLSAHYVRATTNSLTHQDSSSVAGYLDATFNITDQLSVSGGVRYTHDKKSADQLIQRGVALPFYAEGEETWNATTPRVGVDYKVTDDVLVYASWGKGFKAGGLSSLEPSSPAGAAIFIPPENIESREVGVKTEWFDGRLRFNANYFEAEYTDQAQTALVGTPLVTVVFFADAKISGFEFEAHARPTSAWRIDATAGTLDAVFTSLPSVHPANAYADRTLKHSPSLAYMISTDYTFDLPASFDATLELGASYSWTDDTWESVQKTPLAFMPAYDVLDLRATYRTNDGRYEVVLAGTNVMSTEYFKLVTAPANRWYSPRAEWSVTLRSNF